MGDKCCLSGPLQGPLRIHQVEAKLVFTGLNGKPFLDG